MKSSLRLQTKTIGAERIRKAKENNEDIAVLSMFLPNHSSIEENANFYCSAGDYCRQGDPRNTKAGKFFNFKCTVLCRRLLNLLIDNNFHLLSYELCG